MTNLFIGIFSFLCLSGYAQIPEPTWIHDCTDSIETCAPLAIVEMEGSIFIAGTFSGPVTQKFILK